MLDRVGELVTKPVDGHGGIGVLIGPDASAAEVADRRAAIAANPAGWVAQEVVALSSHPTLAGSTGCSPGTSTCGRSSTCAAPGRRTPPWPTWP